MRVLLVSGTGFTGPALVKQLLERDHEVTCLHRGQTQDARTEGAGEIIADRHDKSQLSAAVAEMSPDVLVDMIAFTPEDAPAAVRACKGVVPRVGALI